MRTKPVVAFFGGMVLVVVRSPEVSANVGT
jgi:hypothetical protein